MVTHSTTANLSAASSRLMTTSEAADALRVSRATLYRLANAREITFVRLGRRVLIDSVDLDALITRRKVARGNESGV
jgi:excisionase family DNA binding protein